MQDELDEEILTSEELAPYVHQIKTALHGRAVIEAVVMLAQVAHDLLREAPPDGKEDCRKMLVEFIMMDERPEIFTEH